MMELSAAAALGRSVKFWQIDCGYTEEQVLAQVHRWFDFAYSPAEQDAAKLVFVSARKNSN